ncbi:MAG: alpha/beta hydrolase [Dehalococcoidia bacterium]
MSNRSPLARPVRSALVWTLLLTFALLLAFHVAGGWYFASAIDDRALSAAARRASLTPNYRIQVVEAGSNTVTLSGSDVRLERNGVFGLQWEGGWGIIREILGTSADGSVRRAFDLRGGEPLRAGMHVAIDSRVFPGDPLAGLGIPFEDVAVQGELGDYPAWFISGSKPTWFIFVHGNGLTRRDALRVLPTVVDAGFPVLVPTYRGDEEAPKDPSGKLRYGKTEWRDLEAAVRYALDHGATKVVLDGVSMGGGVVVAFLLESPLADRISGVILDSPMLDFEQTVEFQAERERLPGLGVPLPWTLIQSAELITQLRFGVDWHYTDYLAKASQLVTPILLIHGEEDRTVPVSTSEQLARLRPDLIVDFYRVPDAGHVESWNADPAEYEQRVRTFMGLVESHSR